jgi:multiple sugar transport system substrate-binding protein
MGAEGKLTVIHRTEYFEAAQETFRQVAQDFADANGVELDISTTNPEAFGDFLGKMAAAVQAGNPPDLAYTSNVSISQMALLGLLEDVTDVVEEAQARYGAVVPGINADALGQVNGRWMAVPFLASSVGCFIRGDKLAEAGIDPATLTTWDTRRDAALAMSDPESEFWGWGLTPNQSGDGYGYLMQVIHAHGGSFTDESGTRVVFNSPETVAAFQWLAETYDRNGRFAAMLPPGIESWGDSSNNEAWLAGRIGYTHNSWSVYAQSKRDENPVYPNTTVLPMPTANNGDSRAGGETTGWLTIFRGAPNVELAKELALNLLAPENFNRMSAVAGGLFNPAFENLWTPELLAADPNFAIIREQVTVPDPHLVFSWPAQPNAAIDAIRPLGIVEQAVGNVIAGRMTPEEAVADAHNKIVSVFEEGGLPQD